MSSEESNRMSQKTPSQDLNSDIEWDLKELQDSIKRSAEEQWDALLDSTGQIDQPPGTAEMLWEAEKKRWKQQYDCEDS